MALHKRWWRHKEPATNLNMKTCAHLCSKQITDLNLTNTFEHSYCVNFENCDMLFVKNFSFEKKASFFLWHTIGEQNFNSRVSNERLS